MNQISTFSFYIDKPISKNIKYFIYRGNQYLIDFDLLILYSNFFYKNKEQYKNLENIPLLNEKEEKEMNISEETIKALIKSCQNEKCEINSSLVFELQYLSNKFECNELTSLIEKFINNHSDDLIIDSILFKNKNHLLITQKEVETISKNIDKYIDNTEMINLPISFLERIFQQYFTNNDQPKTQKEHQKIFDFLFKILDKHGKDASVLFSNIDFGEQRLNIINTLLKKYSDRFDFNMINSNLLKTITEITSELNKQKEEFKQLKADEEKRIKEEEILRKEIIKSFEDEIKRIKNDEIKRIEEEKQLRLAALKQFEDEQIQMKMKTQKEIENIILQFNQLLEEQKKRFQLENINQYRILMLQMMSHEQFEKLDEYSQNQYITKIIENENDFKNSKKDSLISQILCSNRFYSLFMINSDEYWYYLSCYPPTKFDFIKSNLKRFKLKSDYLEILYQKELLKKTLIDVFQNYSNVLMKVNFPTLSFRGILTDIFEIRDKLNIFSNNDEIIFLVLDDESQSDIYNLKSVCVMKMICSFKRKIQEINLENINDLIVSIIKKSRSGIKIIKKGDFSECQSFLSKVSLPNSVNVIEDEVFKGYELLKEVFAHSSVVSIGKCAFYECISLINVRIHLTKIESIRNHTFYGCKSLKEITYPSSLTSIEDFAFSGCSSLIKIEFPSSLKSIGKFAFQNCSSLKKIKIPSSIISIGSFAFSECSLLTQIEIPSNLSLIEDGTFSGCSSLMQVSIPPSVSQINSGAFKNCISLTRIKIPSTVKSIKEDAFEGCFFLTKT